MLTYYKCRDCLTAFTSTEAKVQECLCGGKIECMGKVTGIRYHKHEELVPCDARCTDAQGPSCNCQCGGEHHGTSRLVTVCTESGIIKVTALKNADKAIAQSIEFKAVYAEAEARLNTAYGETLQSIKARVFVADKALYFEAVNAERALRHLKSMRVHKSRMQAAKTFLVPKQVQAA